MITITPTKNHTRCTHCKVDSELVKGVELFDFKTSGENYKTILCFCKQCLGLIQKAVYEVIQCP